MRKFKQTKLLLVLVFFAAASALLMSCYPDYGLEIKDFDLVATFKDDAADFQSYSTFFLPDSIREITDGGVVGVSDIAFEQQVLDEIANEMEACGFTRVNTVEASDVALYPGHSSSSTFSYYPGYWWGYYGWYYPWYGYGGGYSYSYTTGSLFITMIDNAKFNAQNKILGAVWAGAANGVLDNSTGADIKARTLNAVHQMFDQSPYLRLTK